MASKWYIAFPDWLSPCRIMGQKPKQVLKLVKLKLPAAHLLNPAQVVAIQVQPKRFQPTGKALFDHQQRQMCPPADSHRAHIQGNVANGQSRPSPEPGTYRPPFDVFGCF
jgi:hypothetical protein